MKGGNVARIRVNPKDCQSVLDLLDKVRIPRQHMSFAQCVSIALSSLLETARINKTLPEPDPFQYINRMGQYLGNGHKHHQMKMRATSAIGSIGEHFQAPALTTEPARQLERTECDHGIPYQYPCRDCNKEVDETPVSANEMRQRRRFSELYSKKDMRESGNMNISWSAEEEAEYQELYKIIYPEG